MRLLRRAGPPSSVGQVSGATAHILVPSVRRWRLHASHSSATVGPKQHTVVYSRHAIMNTPVHRRARHYWGLATLGRVWRGRLGESHLLEPRWAPATYPALG
jgi:hypothetical protein